MPKNPFDGPRAKIERARRHLRELESEQETYAKGAPYETFRRPSQDGWIDVGFRLTSLPSDNAATTVADILGGLRSSLDLAVSAARIADGQTDLKRTNFYFQPTEKQWKASAAGNLKGVPKPIVSAMEAFRPWDDGNPPLCALNRLTNVDKHHLLRAVALKSGEVEIGGIYGFGGGVRVYGPQWDFEANECVLYSVFDENRVIVGPYKLRVFFAFDVGNEVSGEPVIPTLHKFADACDDVVNTFERVSRAHNGW